MPVFCLLFYITVCILQKIENYFNSEYKRDPNFHQSPSLLAFLALPPHNGIVVHHLSYTDPAKASFPTETLVARIQKFAPDAPDALNWTAFPGTASLCIPKGEGPYKAFPKPTAAWFANDVVLDETADTRVQRWTNVP